MKGHSEVKEQLGTVTFVPLEKHRKALTHFISMLQQWEVTFQINKVNVWWCRLTLHRLW